MLAVWPCGGAQAHAHLVRVSPAAAPPRALPAGWRCLRWRRGQVVLVDGNQMFNRPGPRLVDALEFLAGLLHGKPELIPADFPWTRWQAQQAQQA